MLQAILREAQQGGTLEVNRLAARLQVSTKLAQAMLDHLQRLGLLREVPCGAACQDCSLRAACHPTMRLYQLSPDGIAPLPPSFVTISCSPAEQISSER